MTMKKVLMILLLVLLLPTMLIAQEESTSTARQYGLGSQMFTFRLVRLYLHLFTSRYRIL